MKIRGKLISSFGAVTLTMLLVYAGLVYISYSGAIRNSQIEIYNCRVKAALLTTKHLIWEQIRNLTEPGRSNLAGPDETVLPPLIRGYVEMSSKPDGDLETIARYGEAFVPPGSDILAPFLKTINLREPCLLSDQGRIFLLWQRSVNPSSYFLYAIDQGQFSQLVRENLLLKETKLILSRDGVLFLELTDQDLQPDSLLQSYHFEDLKHEESSRPHVQPGSFTPLSDNLYLFPANTEFFGLDLDYLLPRQLLNRDLYRLKNRVVAATIILAWIGVWVILIVAYRLSLPIVRLAKVTNDMIAFNYQTPFEITPSRDEIGNLARSVEIMRQKIEQLVTRDPLTQTYNRRYLMHMFQLSFVKAQRQGEALACIILDVDHFKKINDTYGHQTGDDILRAIGKRLSESTRPYDTVATVARYGGEEFVIILPGLGGQEAVKVAERLRLAVEQHPLQHHISCTISLGVSVLKDHHDSPDTLLNEADQALYLAKKQGRNRTVIFGAGREKDAPALEKPVK